MDFKEMNPLGIIGVIGAIIMVVGVFLNWIAYDQPLLLTHLVESWTGLDVFNGAKNLSTLLDVKYTFLPLFSLICGIIAIVLMILPIVKNDDKFATINNILGIIVLILSAIVVIFGILFLTQDMGALGKYASIQIGFWLTFIGGIITLVGGAMPIVKNKLM